MPWGPAAQALMKLDRRIRKCRRRAVKATTLERKVMWLRTKRRLEGRRPLLKKRFIKEES